MKSLLIGYARCSTDSQDLTAQTQALKALGWTKPEFTLTTASPDAIGSVLDSKKLWLPDAPVTLSLLPSLTA